VVKVECRAVIDEVKLTMPVEEIGVARGAVDVEGEGVEPDGERGDVGVGFVARCGIEHRGAGEIIEGQVESDAGAKEVADLLVGFVASEGGVDLGEDEFRNVEAEGAADSAGDEFGDKGERTLARAAEFDDVEAKVVGLDNCGKRAAFAERGDILGGADGAKHCCLV
jgi:hypothetical protein